MSLGLPTVIATAIGITGSAWWAGATSSISLLTIPSLIETSTNPQAAAKTWAALYHRGAATGPRVSLTVCLALAYSAYDRAREGVAWAPYAVGGALTLAIVPFTLGVMMPTNNALLAVAEGKKDVSLAEARELLGRWQLLNHVRGLFPLAAAAVLLWDVIRV